jgi:toxin FitB
MIVLDTNVISELISKTPDPKVKAWISTLDFKDVFISVPTLMELWSASTRLPLGKRRYELEEK